MNTTKTLNALNDTRTVTPNKYVWGEFTPDVAGVGYKELPVQTEVVDTSTATLAIDVGGPSLVSISVDTLRKGVASLGSDGKVPQEQLPNVSAATPVTALGQISTASLQTNNNYTASVSGSASFTLPTPTDSTIANKITLILNVLANSVIDWGVNANAALAEFTPGKYQIRLLWNNTSSAWSAEVLKETTVDNGVSDLHDIKMTELYSSISALQNELQILKGQSMKRLDYTNAVEFYLKEENQTSYTVPANGYIFGYGFQTYKTAGNSYTGNILINGINVGKYFRKYTLKNDQVDTSIPLSMPLPVSAGDVITITGNREAFQEPYLFVAEKEG